VRGCLTTQRIKGFLLDSVLPGVDVQHDYATFAVQLEILPLEAGAF
jgi:hypothetical protein